MRGEIDDLGFYRFLFMAAAFDLVAYKQLDAPLQLPTQIASALASVSNFHRKKDLSEITPHRNDLMVPYQSDFSYKRARLDAISERVQELVEMAGLDWDEFV